MFQALQEGVILLDHEGHVTYVNQAACPCSDSRRSGWWEQATGGRRARPGLEGTAQAGHGGKPRSGEVFYPENRFLNFYITAIDEAHEAGFVMLIRDVTQTRKLTEEKIESERITALTMLAAGVAHELGNPLNSLTIHLQLMERQLKKMGKELGQAAEVARCGGGRDQAAGLHHQPVSSCSPSPRSHNFCARM